MLGRERLRQSQAKHRHVTTQTKRYLPLFQMKILTENPGSKSAILVERRYRLRNTRIHPAQPRSQQCYSPARRWIYTWKVTETEIDLRGMSWHGYAFRKSGDPFQPKNTLRRSPYKGSLSLGSPVARQENKSLKRRRKKWRSPRFIHDEGNDVRIERNPSRMPRGGKNSFALGCFINVARMMYSLRRHTYTNLAKAGTVPKATVGGDGRLNSCTLCRSDSVRSSSSNIEELYWLKDLSRDSELNEILRSKMKGALAGEREQPPGALAYKIVGKRLRQHSPKLDPRHPPNRRQRHGRESGRIAVPARTWLVTYLSRKVNMWAKRRPECIGREDSPRHMGKRPPVDQETH